MLQHLHIMGVGPSDNLELSFSDRVNILTGDNGLGKSFILDVAWWALTRQWPQKVNPAAGAGRMASPPYGQSGEIRATVSGRTRNDFTLQSTFDRKACAWPLPQGRPVKPGLVVYAMVDGSFAVLDPARNYSRNSSNEEPAPAFVFSPAEVWKGQERPDGTKTCNGLLDDMLYWMNEKGEAYARLKAALEALSPPDEPLTIGGVENLMDNDTRRYPCIRMPYKENPDIPVALVSSAIKRVLALAYFLVWSWQEHCQACRKTGEQVTPDITVIIDEVEAHLHPRWQRNILAALQRAVENLTGCPNVQYIVSTHSPLIMASCEDFFSPADSWLDIDMDNGDVVVTKKVFEKMGDATRWLLSDAFDMTSARSNSSQATLDEAMQLMKSPDFNPQAVDAMQLKLEKALSSRDSFWLRWNFFREKNNYAPRP